MATDDDNRLEAVVFMIEHMVDKGRVEALAKILLRLQEEYIEIATLSTDGEYSSDRWSHDDLLNFLTQGELQ